MKLNLYKTWIELDQQAIAHNVKVFKSLLANSSRLFAVVKSNAYGHGLFLFSKIVDALGVDGFCVDSVVEGIKLRSINIRKPIIVLGPTLPALLPLAANYRLILSVSNFDILKKIIKIKKPIYFHLKIDTGMHRQGFYLQDLPQVIKLIQKSKSKIKNYCQGLYTHFAAAKDVTYPAYTLKQIREFLKAKEIFQTTGFKNLIVHAAATGGALLYPQSHFDLVRIGIGLYGYWPSLESQNQYSLILKRSFELKPVLSWQAVISEVKDFQKGDFVGYDLTEKIPRKTSAAVIPIGYWHGLPRAVSSIGEVLINGYRSKILGRVSMDLITVSVSKKPQIGQIATIIGRQGRNTLTAEDLATASHSTVYEVLTRLNPLIKRIVK